MRLDVDAEPLVHLRRRERAAAARVALRRAARSDSGPPSRNDIGQAGRRHHAERVAVAARVLDGDQPLVAGDAHAHRAPLRLEDRRVRLVELADAQVAAQPQQVVQMIGVRRDAAAATPRPRRARRRRSARAAPPARAARAAGRGRATAPAHAARPAACRPRTCRSRCSRRAATTRTATPTRVSTSTRSSSRVRSPCSSCFSAGRSKTSCRHSRYVSSTIGKLAYLRATCSRPCAFSRCCQSGVRSPGRRRGISSARAAFSRKRAPKSAVCPTSASTSSSSSSAVEQQQIGRRAARRRPADGTRCRRPTRSTAPRSRATRAAARRPPSPTARARARRTA